MDIVATELRVLNVNTEVMYYQIWKNIRLAAMFYNAYVVLVHVVLRIINHCRKSLLFSDNKTWKTKQHIAAVKPSHKKNYLSDDCVSIKLRVVNN